MTMPRTTAPSGAALVDARSATRLPVALMHGDRMQTLDNEECYVYLYLCAAMRRPYATPNIRQLLEEHVETRRLRRCFPHSTVKALTTAGLMECFDVAGTEDRAAWLPLALFHDTDVRPQHPHHRASVRRWYVANLPWMPLAMQTSIQRRLAPYFIPAAFGHFRTIPRSVFPLLVQRIRDGIFNMTKEDFAHAYLADAEATPTEDAGAL